MNSCIFCQIVQKNIPATIIYEDDVVLAFPDINPLAKTHIIVIPKECCLFFHDIPDSTIISLSHAIKTIVKDLGLDQTGYRLVNNNGAHGAQSVPHAHIHIIGGEQLGHRLQG
ncbi:MAG: HIT domain-containing protein [Brevinema sp.]